MTHLSQILIRRFNGIIPFERPNDLVREKFQTGVANDSS